VNARDIVSLASTVSVIVPPGHGVSADGGSAGAGAFVPIGGSDRSAWAGRDSERAASATSDRMCMAAALGHRSTARNPPLDERLSRASGTR
jgi:hypothetical protein